MTEVAVKAHSKYCPPQTRAGCLGDRCTQLAMCEAAGLGVEWWDLPAALTDCLRRSAGC